MVKGVATRVLLGSNPAVGTSLRKFTNSVYPTLPVSFEGETLKAVGPFHQVAMPGEVKEPTQGVV